MSPIQSIRIEGITSISLTICSDFIPNDNALRLNKNSVIDSFVSLRSINCRISGLT